MFSAFKKYDSRQVRIIISLLLILVLVLPPVSNLVVSKVFAGALTSYNVQINNSQANASGVTYTFNWVTSATTAIAEIDIQVCDTPSGTCNAPSGFSTGTPTLVSSNIAGSSITTTGTTANKFKLNVGSPASQSNQTMTIIFSGVHNPTAANTTSYIRTTTYSDAGVTAIDGPTTAAFAVLDTSSIAVSATVDPNFTFSIARAVSGSVNGDLINVSSTTNNSIPFGTLNTSVASVAAHDITISTNASNGYTVTASSAATSQAGFPPLVSGTSDNIDSFTGTNASPTNWSAPGGSTPDVNTGYFGYTTEDSTLCTGSANRFTSGGPNYAGFTTTGQELICSATPVATQTTRVGWKLGINAVQPAGTYTGTIILVATPTY